QCAELLDQMFPRNPGEEIPLDYVWPGGRLAGSLKSAVDDNPPGFRRLNVRWPTNMGAPSSPLPWRLGDPGNQPFATFSGNPNATTAEQADAEWAQLNAQDTDP